MGWRDEGERKIKLNIIEQDIHERKLEFRWLHNRTFVDIVALRKSLGTLHALFVPSRKTDSGSRSYASLVFRK